MKKLVDFLTKILSLLYLINLIFFVVHMATGNIVHAILDMSFIIFYKLCFGMKN